MQISNKLQNIIRGSGLYDPMKRIVLARGQESNPDFVFIGDAPGRIDDKEGKPFVGEVGEMLDSWIARAFVTSYCVTNVVPLMPLDENGEVRNPTKEEIDYFKFFVDWVIDTVNPKYIVAMGSGACYGLFGKEEYGSIQMFGDKKGVAISDGADEDEFYAAIKLLESGSVIKKDGIDVEEKMADQYDEHDDEETGEEGEEVKEIEYAESIIVPKQRVRNEAVKYMINEQLAFFRVAAEMTGSEFKDIDSKEYFYWNNTKFFSYMKSSTQGRDLIVFKSPSSEQVAILYETPTNYELVGVVSGDEVRTAEVRAIPGAGDVKYISFMNFHPIAKFFKLKRVKSKEGDEKAVKTQRYFPLHVHTEYSIGDGANKTEELARVLSKMGFIGAAVSDHGHMNGTYYFQKDLGAKGLKTVLGVEMYIYDEDEFPKTTRAEKKGDEQKEEQKEEKEKKHRYHITLYAKNAKGWENLLELMWIACTEGFYYKPRILLKHLFKYKEGIIATSGCLDGFLMYHCRSLEIDKAMKYAKKFKKEFGDDYYAEVMPHHEIQGFAEVTKSVMEIAKNVGIKMVVSLDAHYPEEKDKKIHNAVLAINRRKKIHEVGYTGNTYYIMDDDELSKMLNEKFNILVPEIYQMFDNTMEIANKCDYRIEKFKAEETMPFDANSQERFKTYLEDAFSKRWFKDNSVYRERLDFEMDRILTKGYDGYFLMVMDIIDTAKSLNVMYGPGRGSVAGSLVAYLMGMHSADPIEHELLFDRFISDMRKDMPDVDMDFQDSGRKKLITKLVEKYGEDRVCGIMAFSKMHGKGAIRDTGRICEVDRGECEQVASLVVTRSGGDARQNFSLEDTFEEFEGAKDFKNRHPEESAIAIGIEGRIRHCTKHAAGLVITKDPIRKYVPVYRVNGEVVTGWEKKAIEDLGIVKMDVLGLKALDVVARSVEKTGAILPDKFNDTRVYDTVFKVGNTAGIFQFESPGLTKYVKDMECDNFNSLTDATSLYRPGPLHSGMAMIYLQRKKGLKPIEHEHEKLREITKDTFGIMIYQEQIMRIMHDIGGFSWSTSEMIRKVISKSMGKSLFEELQDKFVKHAVETLGMSVRDAEKIYNATSMFGSYGFNRSHGCSYSILSYWMAFLKTYHPEVFFSVLLDRENDPEMAKRYVENAKKMGVSVLPPDVNKSEAGYSMVPDSKTVICGIQAIKGIGVVAVKSVIKGRPYNSVEDMVKGLKKNIFKVIVQSGSADDIVPSRKWCLENVEEIYAKKYDFSKVPKTAKEFDDKERVLKQNDVLDFHMDKHISSYFTDPFGDKIKYERIADMKFESYVSERWIKGAVNFINFKQEGLEGNWMLFADGVLERKYAHLNVNDESGGNVLVHISPEQYTYYKRILERKKFPIIVKGHTIPEYQKLYCDAMIVLDDINKDNPIFDYVSGVSARKAKAIKRRMIEARQKNVYVGVLVGATYKVKDKRAFVRLVFSDGAVYFTDEITPGQIYVAGNVIKGKLVSKKSLAEIEVF